jgi:hypothetical protein
MTLRHRLGTLLSMGRLLVCLLASAIAHAQPVQDGAPEALAKARTWGAVLNPGGEARRQGRD